jgi:hypothetical protein
MERELTIGQQKNVFDREATVDLYRETIKVAGSESCDCIYCKNVAAQKQSVFPSGLSPEDEMAYRRTMLEGERIKSQQNVPYTQIAFWSLASGLYALLGGLAVWIFYRMAWFAVRG